MSRTSLARALYGAVSARYTMVSYTANQMHMRAVSPIFSETLELSKLRLYSRVSQSEIGKTDVSSIPDTLSDGGGSLQTGGKSKNTNILPISFPVISAAPGYTACTRIVVCRGS